MAKLTLTIKAGEYGGPQDMVETVKLLAGIEHGPTELKLIVEVLDQRAELVRSHLRALLAQRPNGVEVTCKTLTEDDFPVVRREKLPSETPMEAAIRVAAERWKQDQNQDEA